jgi:hypothetical protein
MILDSQLMFSDAQAITAAAGSDNTLDMSKASHDVGQGQPMHVVLVVDVAFTDGSSDSTLTVALEGDSTTSFTPDGTQDLFTIPALAAIGDTFIGTVNPGATPATYRYLRLKYTPNNGNLSTGSVTAFLTSDIAKWKAYAKNYTIS